MAAPLPSGKQTVNLAAGNVRVSSIRRDPPPPVKQLKVVDADEDDQRTVVLGILLFSAALFVAIVGLAFYLGWTPRDVTINWTD
jgi:hypothetical protein